MRYLAIDLGARRTGLALGSDETGVVTPLEVIDVPSGPRLIDALVKAIEANRPDAVVIGLPVNMDGTEGPAAKNVRATGGTLHARCGAVIHYQDERLSSHAAEEHLKQSGKTHEQKRRLRDALAAGEILRQFLDERDDPA